MNLLIIFLPFIAVTLGGYFFPIKKNSHRPVFQPPNWVFGVIWTYITLSFGIITNLFLSTIKSKADCLKIVGFYLLIIFCLVYWLYLNSKSYRKKSFYLLVLTTYISIVYLIYLRGIGEYFPSTNLGASVWFLLPLPFWLVLASCLNGVTYDHDR